MSRCRCDPISVAGCQCSADDSNCFSISGAGTAANPFTVSSLLDADPANLLACSVAGFAAFLPLPLRNPPAACAYHSVDQAIGVGVSQVIAFSHEYYDTDSMHDNVVNNGTLTFNTAGIYAVSLNAQWKKNTALGDRELKIRKNGTDFLAADARAAVFASDGTTAIDIKVSVTCQEYFAAGDYVEALAQNVTAATVLIIEAARNSPIFAATWLRGAP